MLPPKAKTKSVTLVVLSELSGVEYVSPVPKPIMVQSQPRTRLPEVALPTRLAVAPTS